MVLDAVGRHHDPAHIEDDLPSVRTPAQLRKATDDSALEAMTKVIFQVGFNWSVVEKKWPGFLEVFSDFDFELLAFLPEEEFDRMASDTRIIRNATKVRTVRDNACFLQDMQREYVWIFFVVATVSVLLVIYHMFTWRKLTEDKETSASTTLIQRAKAFKAHFDMNGKVVPVEVVRFRSPRVGHAGLQHDHAVHVYVAARDRFGALLGIGVGPRVSVALAVAAKHRAAPGRAAK